mmetsp:Transcript_39843/g.109657  ORF Transcript_39843/g.109657 Transcript_39843/m.109657 type:complete len:195 (-) Transcript_39843:28-612(-)
MRLPKLAPRRHRQTFLGTARRSGRRNGLGQARLMQRRPLPSSDPASCHAWLTCARCKSCGKRWNVRPMFALPHIVASPARVKAVIFVGSTGSQWSFPYCGGYCASKHALRGFAGSVFPEVRDKGVKVCVIMPGFTDTDMVASNKGMIKEKMMRPDDVAHTVECVLGFPPSACPTEIVVRPQFDCTDGSVPYTIV